MFSTLLIADRGEIVMRIARTCERLGVRTLVVHAEADASASYLAACDEALPVAMQDGQAIIDLAKQHGAEAIHPGTSSLSSDPAFAHAVREAGLVFVGAEPEILE